MKRLIYTIAIGGIVAGCTLSSEVQQGAMSYNEAIANTSNQLLLLNILRASEHAPLYLSTFNTIHGSFSLSAGLGSSGVTIPFGPTHPPTGNSTSWQYRYSASPTFTVNSSPTFDSGILDGQQTTQGLLTPIDAKIFKYYWDRNIPHQILLYLFMQQISDDEIQNIAHYKRLVYQSNLKNQDVAAYDALCKEAPVDQQPLPSKLECKNLSDEAKQQHLLDFEKSTLCSHKIYDVDDCEGPSDTPSVVQDQNTLINVPDNPLEFAAFDFFVRKYSCKEQDQARCTDAFHLHEFRRESPFLISARDPSATTGSDTQPLIVAASQVAGQLKDLLGQSTLVLHPEPPSGQQAQPGHQTNASYSVHKLGDPEIAICFGISPDSAKPGSGHGNRQRYTVMQEACTQGVVSDELTFANKAYQIYTLRSAEEVIQYLGGLIRNNLDITFFDPVSQTQKHLFRLQPIPADLDNGNTTAVEQGIMPHDAITVSYLGKPYYVRGGDPDDYTLQTLTLLEQIINLQRNANEVPATKAVEIVP